MSHPVGLRRIAQGFTMVELLVGMAIGLLATIVIMQVYESFEGQKRTTTAGADGQTNGSIALFNVKRDLEMAGYGLPVFSTRNPALLCDPLPTIDHDSDAATPEIGFYPVLLSDGGVGPGANDMILLTYGNTSTGGVPNPVTVAGTSALVSNNLACKTNDIALLINGPVCSAEKITNVAGTTSITLQNSPAVTSGVIACLGGWNEIAYAINNNALTRNGLPNVAGIMSMQAQYGISPAAGNNAIVQWVEPTGDWELTKVGNVLTKPILANRNRIKAIRVALVARSGLWEKEIVSDPCSSTTAANPIGLCAWEGTPASPAPTIDLSSDPEWRHYRYRVYEVIIPLRNVIWSLNTLA